MRLSIPQKIRPTAGQSADDGRENLSAVQQTGTTSNVSCAQQVETHFVRRRKSDELSVKAGGGPTATHAVTDRRILLLSAAIRIPNKSSSWSVPDIDVLLFSHAAVLPAPGDSATISMTVTTPNVTLRRELPSPTRNAMR